MSFLRTVIFAAIAVCLVFVQAGPRATQADTPLTPEAALTRVFDSASLEPAWFTRAFLAQVPLTQAQSIIDQYRAELGALKSVQASGNGYRLAFERGSVRATLTLDEFGAISGFLLGVPQSSDREGTMRDAVASIRALPGKTSLLVMRDGVEREAIAPDTRIAVGSAFKLAVLAALQDQVAAGKHRWDEVVTLRREWKSLPSGILQDWPDGSQLTLQTLASLMISRSDNTAADALVDIVGRREVERYAPGNEPLLTTREAFTLKVPRLSGLLERYRAASPAQRRAMLTEINAQPFGWLGALAPRTLDIEWFFSARELCGLLAKTGDLDLFEINPGVAQREDWQSIAYKGGSEPGVINLSQQLTDANGTKWCVVATWNDQAADEDAFIAIVSQLIGALH